jgi:CRISPR/Cas system-associated endoribonuclease Cas2
MSDVTEFDEDYVRNVSDVMSSIRRTVSCDAETNIKRAQERQRTSYNRRHSCKYKYQVGDKVLVRNLKRDDRKGGKSKNPWIGPYVISDISNNNTCALTSEAGQLKSKQHLCNLKPFYERDEGTPTTTESADDNVSSSATVPTNGPWIADLHLGQREQEDILQHRMLDDKVINAAQTLLRRQYQVEGLDSSLLCQAGGFQSSAFQCVQIHYDESRLHWVTSSTVRGRVEVADSLYNGRLSDSLINQLRQRYATLAVDNQISVFVLPVQQQTNGVDCGVHAIASAIEFLVNDGDPLAHFDLRCMRQHLATCLEQGEMESFPRSSKKPRGRKPKIIELKITLK